MELNTNRNAEDLAYQDSKVTGLLASVNETSVAASAGWVLFIAAMAYFFIALAGVSHEDFLLNKAVNQPILNVDVDLHSFFLFAPLVLVFVHFGILVQHEMLASKVRALDHALLSYEGVTGYRTHPMRRELHSYFFTQSIAGPRRAKLLLFFLNTMSWITLFFMPILTLLAFQVTYLPYHDSMVTWWHSIYLVIDIIIFLIMGTLSRFLDSGFFRGLSLHLRYNPTSFMGTNLVAAAALFFSFFVATLPDSFSDRVMRNIWPTPLPYGWQAEKPGDEPTRYAFWLTAYLFEGKVDLGSGSTESMFTRNIVVVDKDDLIKAKDWNPEETSLSLRSRDFSYASFDLTDMRGVDFSNAILTGARFYNTKLQNAKFNNAQMQNADLRGALFSGKTSMEKANLDGADLRGLKFDILEMRFASLQGAKLQGIKLNPEGQTRYLGLQGANLQGAQLQDARLDKAFMHGANLQNANLQGAYVQMAHLIGANLENADLRGADLSNVNFVGASLKGANLQGTLLTEANLLGADLSNAKLQGAFFYKTQIWQTHAPTQDQINLAEFREIDIADKYASLSGHGGVAEIADKDVREAVVQKLGDVLNYKTREGWASSQDHKNWTNLQGKRATPEEVSLFLADQVCKDNSNAFYLARSLVAHISQRLSSSLSSSEYSTYVATVNPVLFRQKTSENTCAGAKGLKFDEMVLMEEAVKKYSEQEEKVSEWKKQNAPQQAPQQQSVPQQQTTMPQQNTEQQNTQQQPAPQDNAPKQ